MIVVLFLFIHITLDHVIKVIACLKNCTPKEEEVLKMTARLVLLLIFTCTHTFINRSTINSYHLTAAPLLLLGQPIELTKTII